MTLANSDLVQETTSTTGTGTLTLSGAVAGYQSFAIVGTGNTTYYCIRSGTNKEVGIGTYTASGTTLSRDTVLYSSAGGTTKITVAAGATVINTYPAETSVSGGGGGTYPTVQPTLNLDFANTKLLDHRITFVRNSTAAYYDGQTTAMAEQNLFLQSQAYTNASWIKSAATATGTYTAPDGTTTANLLTLSAQYGGVLQAIYLISGVTYTISIYALAVTGTNTYSFRNDTSGTTLGTFTPTSSWARYTVTFTASATGTANIWPIQDRNASGFGSVYIWGAQLEQRSSVTAYTPTTTAAITNYIPVLMTAPAGVARFDCDPITGKSLGLLIEESRTNLALQSSGFSTTPWNTYNSGSGTQTQDSISPDGTLNAWTLNDTSITAYSGVQQILTISASTTYTYSCYVKQGTSAAGFCIWLIGSASTFFQNTIAWTGGVPTATGWASQLVGDGWYRMSYTFASGTSTSVTSYLLPAIQSTSATGSTIFWGAQLEAGSFATSYIPTVASTVTRAADQASMTGTNFSSWYNQSQGSFYTNIARISLVNNNWVFAIACSNTLDLVFGSTTANFRYGFGNNTNSTGVYSSALAASSYTGVTATICVNGGAVTSSTSTGIPFNSTSISIGSSLPVGTSALNGHIRKLSYYPVALSSNNLVALTS